MSNTAILVIGFVYLYAAVDKIRAGETGLGITFFGYALGNLGLYIASK